MSDHFACRRCLFPNQKLGSTGAKLYGGDAGNFFNKRYFKVISGFFLMID